MEVIELTGYTEDEKIEIAKRYMVKRQVEANGLKPEQVEVTEDALRRIARDYTREAGVRSLEREIGAVLRNVAVQIAEGKIRRRRSVPSRAGSPIARSVHHLSRSGLRHASHRGGARHFDHGGAPMAALRHSVDVAERRCRMHYGKHRVRSLTHAGLTECRPLADDLAWLRNYADRDPPCKQLQCHSEPIRSTRADAPTS
jgi:ATP-dependent Lon protease